MSAALPATGVSPAPLPAAAVPAAAPPLPPISHLDRDHLRPEAHCHAGIGSVHVYRPYLRSAHGELVDFIDLVVVPSGATIGRHRHGNNTEWYVILQGSGRMWFDGAERDVHAGDILVNPPFGEHGLVNQSGADIRLLVFQLSHDPVPALHEGHPA